MRQELTPIQAEYVGRNSLTTQSQAPINIVVNAQPTTAVSGRSGLSMTLLSAIGAFFIGVLVYSLITGTSLMESMQQLESVASQLIAKARSFIDAKF